MYVRGRENKGFNTCKKAGTWENAAQTEGEESEKRVGCVFISIFFSHVSREGGEKRVKRIERLLVETRLFATTNCKNIVLLSLSSVFSSDVTRWMDQRSQLGSRSKWSVS